MRARCRLFNLCRLGAAALLVTAGASLAWAQQAATEQRQEQRQRQEQQRQQDPQADQQQQPEQHRQQQQEQERQQREQQQQRAPQQREQDDDETEYTGQERAALGILLGESQRGVRVTRVLDDSPAEQAGLRRGDKVLRVDDRQIESYRDLIRIINRKDPNERIQLTIERDGDQQQVQINLAQRRQVFDDQQQMADRRQRDQQQYRDQRDRQDQDRLTYRQRDPRQDQFGQQDRWQQDQRQQDQFGRQDQWRQDQFGQPDRRQQDQRQREQFGRQDQWQQDQWQQDQWQQDQWQQDQWQQDQFAERDQRRPGQRGQAMLGVSVEPADRGVWVTSVHRNSPAQQAGLREGDKILAIDGQQVRSSDQVVQQLRQYQAGDRVQLDVERDQQRGQLMARLQDQQEILAGPAAEDRWRDQDRFDRYQQRERFDDRDFDRQQQWQDDDGDQPAIGINLSRQRGRQGVLIEDVYEGSPADRSGLRSGDEILSIEGREVQATSDLKREIERHQPHQQVELIILRDGQQQRVGVTLARRQMLEDDGFDRGDDQWRDQQQRRQFDREQYQQRGQQRDDRF